MSSLGLDAPMLQMLVTGSAGTSHATEHEKSINLQYEFEGMYRMGPLLKDLGTTQHFQPKILLTIDDNVAVSAGLSPKTRSVLEDLMNERRRSAAKQPPKIEEITEEDQEKEATEKDVSKDTTAQDKDIANGATEETIFETDEDLAKKHSPHSPLNKPTETDDPTSEVEELSPSTHHTRTIEITLRADSEFFNLLTKELSSIDKIEARQKALLTTEVRNLGSKVVSVTRPSHSSSQSDLYAWREIFSLYRDAAVFFANTERHRGARTAVQARERIQWFTDQLAKTPVTRKFKNKESVVLLGKFMEINTSLLRTLLFQEMNSTATQKILKKFDKRTSLTYFYFLFGSGC